MRFGRKAAFWLLAILVCAGLDARVSSWVQARSGGGHPTAAPAAVAATHLPGGVVAAAAPHHPRLHGWARVRQHWLGTFDLEALLRAPGHFRFTLLVALALLLWHPLRG